MKKQPTTTRDGLVVAGLLVAMVVILCLASCSILHRTQSRQQSKIDSTATTQVQVQQTQTHDSAGTTILVDSGTKQTWWEIIKETTTQESIDTATGKVMARTITQKEKSQGTTRDAYAGGLLQWSAVQDSGSKLAQQSGTTTVKKESQAAATTTNRWGANPVVIGAALAALLVLIWWKWEDFATWLFAFGKREKKQDGSV